MYHRQKKERDIVAEEVYELENTAEQIFFELFKVIQNSFVINKCENCGRLFIPATNNNNNPYQKARNDQKYYNNLYLNTGKTCKEIGASNKHKEKRDSYDDSQIEKFRTELKNLSNLYFKN